MRGILQLTGRYHRNHPIDKPGYETERLDLEIERTALVVMHCWNIGCEDGPPADVNFSVGMGFPAGLAEAERIMKEHIAPAAEAARGAGVQVCHVENHYIGMNDPRAQEDMDPPEGKAEPVAPVVPGWPERMLERAHGPYLSDSRSPYLKMRRAKVLDPKPGEIYVWQTGQFDRALRRRGIENLIYTGFATDMCILRSPGGAEAMLPRGYRVFLMRDGTLGIEYPDTFEQRLMTFWGVRYFEAHCGDSITSADFVKVCEASQ